MKVVEEKDRPIQDRIDDCNDAILIHTIESLLPWCFEANQVCRCCYRPPGQHKGSCSVLAVQKQLSKLKGEIIE